MKQYLICVLIFMICFTKNTTAQELNLDMEEVDAYSQPAVWRLGHDPEQPLVYRLLADSIVKHSGRYSLKITSNSNRAKFGSCYIQIPLQLSGKTVMLKGFVKTENVLNGFGSLFLALCNDSTTLQYDNFQKAGMVLTGTHDWKEFSTTLSNSGEVTKINFGGLLIGQGTVWVDDLTLLVDNIKIEKSPVLQPEMRDPRTGKMVKFKR